MAEFDATRRGGVSTPEPPKVGDTGKPPEPSPDTVAALDSDAFSEAGGPASSPPPMAHIDSMQRDFEAINQSALRSRVITDVDSELYKLMGLSDSLKRIPPGDRDGGFETKVQGLLRQFRAASDALHREKIEHRQLNDRFATATAESRSLYVQKLANNAFFLKQAYDRAMTTKPKTQEESFKKLETMDDIRAAAVLHIESASGPDSSVKDAEEMIANIDAAHEEILAATQRAALKKRSVEL